MDYPKSVPSVGLVNGKFVDENPVTGQVGSLISSQWGNAVTDELLNVIRAGGKVPAEAEHDQLLAAIKAIVRDSIPPEKIRTTLAEYGITDAYTKSVTYTKAEIEALLKNMSALPVGAMVPFPKGTVPPGFLEVDGSVQSAATYPDLAAYLGTTFNTGGEGAGNFRLPESRGEFLRGWDHGRGVDAGRSPGSWQADAFQGHYHASAADTAKPYSTGGTIGDYLAHFGTGNPTTNGVRDAINNGVDGTPRTASETRPRNLAVMWCIKAWNAPINQGNIDVAALAAEVQKLKALSGSSYQGLYVSASGTNALVSVKARSLIVGKGSAAQALSAVDLSINLQTTGLNGLDSGVVAASSWYSAWVVSNGTQVAGIAALMPAIQCTTTAGSAVITGIASTAAMRPGMAFGGVGFPPGAFIKAIDSSSQITASVPATNTSANTILRFAYEPVLPVGYVAARVSAFVTDATTKFPLSFAQCGSRVQYRLAASSNLTAYPRMSERTVGVPTTWTAVGTDAFIPPTASSIAGFATSIGTSNSANISVAPSNLTPSGAVASYANPMPMSITANTLSGSFQFDFLLEGFNIYWCGGAGTNSNVLACQGWEDSL
ncbi:phage tail protein [Pseudomonas protegens]|uniref:phage tail protein n=1 Tax=Pseudomonas protegens TaxID=380021 RepID=UPI0018053CA1|nr:phage tail protein [Pseudomonas protegens]